MGETKKCMECGETKPLSEFYLRRASRDGHQPLCKGCSHIKSKGWYAKHIDELCVRAKEYRDANPDYQTQRRYGISRKEYDDLLAKPCGIDGCGQPSEHLDHIHGTKIIRGGLCAKHNKILYDGATSEEFRALARYL